MESGARESRTQLWRQLVKDMFGTIGIRLVVTALSLTSGLVLARLLGADAYGDYAYATTIVILLSFLATAGHSGLAVREIAQSDARSQWSRLRGFGKHATVVTIIVSVLLAAATAGFYVLSPPSSLDAESLAAVLIVITSLPFLALIRLRRGILIGLGHPVQAQVSYEVVLPVLVIGLAWGLRAWGKTTGVFAGGAYVLAMLLSFSAAVWLTRGATRRIPRAAPETSGALWVRASLWFLAINVSMILSQQFSTFILGTLLSTREAGLFSVVIRLGVLINFVHVAVHIPVGPLVARLHSEGRIDDIKWVGVRCARVSLVGAILIAGAFALFGKTILSWHGPEFAAGYSALVIFASGQTFNVAAGALGILLCMTGHARDNAIAGGLAGLLSAGLAIGLIPRYGVIGAAVGATIAPFVWNSLMLWWVYRRLGIFVAAFAPTRRVRTRS